MAPTVKFASEEPFTNHAKMILRSAAREVWSEPVQMERAEPGEGVIGFGVDSGIRSLAPSQITTFPGAKSALVAAFFALESDLPLTPWPDADPETVLYLDIESHGVEHRWDMAPREFFRLGQYAWGPTGEVHLTTDYDEVLSVIRRAHGVIAHNGHSFDLSVLFGKDSIEPLLMAKDRRLFDTMVFAGLAFPAPDKFTTSSGHTFYDGAKPEKALKWLGLDNLCYQFGTQGKIGDLKALAKKYGGFGSIPTDDPEFTRYAVQDVVALQELTTLLLRIHTPSEYDWREQLNAAIDAQNSRNGFCVDEVKARARVEELRLRKEVILARLEEDYGFPTTGKSPWATKAGKEAILKALADYGIVPEEIENWTRTATGNISLGGQTLIDFTLGTDAEEFGQALAELKGQRSLAQLALDSMQSDGKVHPEITALQRSGRKSTTKPGLTIWGSREGRDVEKAYFVASPGRKLVELDYSAADARIVAAYSGDIGFAKRFEPGADAHDISGVIFFGQKRYEKDRKALRPIAKACIAEGELVDTDHGFVPIQDLTTDMRVWDGESYVTHRGTVFTGIKPVITHDGLTATEDHIVFINDSSAPGALLEVPFGLAAARNHPLAQARPRGQGARTSQGYQPGESIHRESEGLLCGGPVHPVREDGVDRVSQHLSGTDSRVQHLCSGSSTPVSAVAGKTTCCDSTEVRESSEPRVPSVRRSRDSLRVRFNSGGVRMGLGVSGAIRTGDDSGPDQHEPRIRTGEPPVGYHAGATGEQEEHSVVRIPSGALALRLTNRTQVPAPRIHPGPDHRIGPGSGSDEGFPLSPRSRETRVYDIRDAGPHHRYAVSGRLVHNCNHALSYRVGSKKLASVLGMSVEEAKGFIDAYQTTYPDVAAWQNRVTDEGDRGQVINDWGRIMQIATDRSFTQSSALYGQSGTRELMVDALIRMLYRDIRLVQYLSAQVHDALVMDIPEEELDWAVPAIVECMETTWGPAQGGQQIRFPVEAGNPADDWQAAGH